MRRTRGGGRWGGGRDSNSRLIEVDVSEVKMCERVLTERGFASTVQYTPDGRPNCVVRRVHTPLHPVTPLALPSRARALVLAAS